MASDVERLSGWELVESKCLKGVGRDGGSDGLLAKYSEWRGRTGEGGCGESLSKGRCQQIASWCDRPVWGVMCNQTTPKT